MKLGNLYAVVAAFALMITAVGCGDSEAPVIDGTPADAPAVEGDGVAAPGEPATPAGEPATPAGE